MQAVHPIQANRGSVKTKMNISAYAYPGIHRYNSVTVGMIIVEVCKQFNVGHHQLMRKSRKREITLPRQAIMYFMYMYLSNHMHLVYEQDMHKFAEIYRKMNITRKGKFMSVIQIGIEFNQHHATVCHSLDIIQNLIDTDVNIRKQIESINNYLLFESGFKEKDYFSLKDFMTIIRSQKRVKIENKKKKKHVTN